MRLIARMSQAEYSRLCKVAPRVLAEIEAGRGNPRVETLEKLLKPFGYEVGVVAPKPVEPIRRIARQVVTRAELNRILTQELRKVGGFEDATLRMMYVFPTPDETGANWSADVVFNAGSGSGLGSRAVVDKIVKTARERYSVRD